MKCLKLALIFPKPPKGSVGEKLVFFLRGIQTKTLLKFIVIFSFPLSPFPLWTTKPCTQFYHSFAVISCIGTKFKQPLSGYMYISKLKSTTEGKTLTGTTLRTITIAQLYTKYTINNPFRTLLTAYLTLGEITVKSNSLAWPFQYAQSWKTVNSFREIWRRSSKT